MKVSFGSFVPVKVFLNGKEVKNTDDSSKKTIEAITLRFCENMMRYKNYDKTYLSEQQRRFFAAMVYDYTVPKDDIQTKAEAKSSNIVTVNCDKERFLVTGDDINVVKNIGSDYGRELKNISNDVLKYAGEDMTSDQQEEHICRYRRGLSKSRVNELKKEIQNNGIGETLYLNAETEVDNPKRSDYKITLIDFKA